MHVDDLDPDPIRQLAAWWREAGTDEVCLATASSDGMPAARMVLLRGLDDGGAVFYTNYTSAKAADLEANPRAALCFRFPPDRQVRLSGGVVRVALEESDSYWRNRPRGSQLGAWASHQSAVIASRQVLEQRVAELAGRFGDGAVPVPPFWGGYRVAPETVEFWHHRPDRLHDRIRYRRAATDPPAWVRERLSP